MFGVVMHKLTHADLSGVSMENGPKWQQLPVKRVCLVIGIKIIMIAVIRVLQQQILAYTAVTAVCYI